jgi:hypothetical protein
MIGFFLQPSNGKETSARMLQNDPIDRDLNVVINQGRRKVEEDGKLVKNSKEHREGSPQSEVDEGKEEN